MPDVDLHKTPIQWAALVAAAALFWGVVWGVGSQFRDHLLADVRGLISAHADSATSNRVEFFRAIESKADRAVDRIGQLEQNCAKFQDWRGSTDAHISVLDDWRQRCSTKQAEFTQWMGRDSRDVDELKQDIRELREEIRKRK